MCNQVACKDGYRDADDETDENLQECSSQDEPDDLGAIGAECHAYSDFTGATLDGVGGDAIKADGGEDEGENAEESRHLGHSTLRIEVGVDVLPHGDDVLQGDVGVNLAENAANLRLDSIHAAMELEDCSFNMVGAVIDHLHHGVVIFDVLRQGSE